MNNCFNNWKLYAILAVILTVPEFVFGQTLTVGVGDALPAAEENFVDLTINPQLETPSALSLFFTKERQNISLLLTINPVEDASKRVKYSEESLQLAKFVINEANDAAHSDMTIDLIKRSEDLINDLNERKEKFLLKDNSSAKNLAQNIIVHLKHKDDIMNNISGKVERNTFVDKEVNSARFLEALDALKNAVIKYRQEIVQPVNSAGGQLRGIGVFKNDQDRDGVPDNVEKEMGLSTIDPDTDGDGLADKKEIEVYGTDPTKVDTDGDGFWDGMEIISGYNPLGNGKMDDKAIKQRSVNSEKFLNRLKTEKQLTTVSLDYFAKVKTKFIYLNLSPQPLAPVPVVPR